MATSNFDYDNILVAVDTEDFDDFEVDELIDSVRDTLDERIKSGYSIDERDNDSLRSYGGRFIFTVNIDGALGTYKTIKVVVRSGYYSGINFDYVVSDLIDYEQERKTLENKVTAMSKRIEKILCTFGTQLRVSARFSNGETMYQAV